MHDYILTKVFSVTCFKIPWHYREHMQRIPVLELHIHTTIAGSEYDVTCFQDDVHDYNETSQQNTYSRLD